MSPTETGRLAEARATTYLQEAGFNIVDRNWRNRWCEIDIVAAKHGRLHFVEVKYRRSNDFGGPLDYITPDKLQRLARAAASWVQTHNYRGDYQIDAIAAGPDTLDYLPNIGGQ